jgi:hypothetical protein
MGETLGGLGLLLVVLGIVLAVAWIILPFAIIGTKPLLQELIQEVRKTNALLQGKGVSTSGTLPKTEATDAGPKEEKGFLRQIRENAAAEWAEFRGKAPDR